MILAVLDRKAGLGVSVCDVFVNVAGGARIDEPAIDEPAIDAPVEEEADCC